MTAMQYDIVVLGAGHNGLTAAALLAKAGLSVLVVEKNDVVGGAAVTETFAPGFRNSVASYTVSLLSSKVIESLDLYRHGLRVVERPAANFWPLDDARGVLIPNDTDGRRAAIRELDAGDAERLQDYDADLERAADVLRGLLLKTPPNAGGGVLEMLRAGLAGREALGLSVKDKRVLLDLFTASAQDFLERYFRNETVKAMFAFDGIVGAYAAPSTPGTAYVLLHHCFGEVNGRKGAWGHAMGGMGSISAAMTKAAEGYGATIRTKADVKRLIVEDGRVVGVVLENGERISARAVAAAVGPKLLFRDLIAKTDVAPDIARPFQHIKTGSGTFRMNVALSELPNFTCRPGTSVGLHHGAGIIIGPTIDYLENAYLDARRDGWSRAPVVEMLIPSTIDDSLAPSGQHVASLFVQHVAPKLPGTRSWADPAEKERFADVVIETVTRYAPNFSESVLHRQILSPLDLEHRFGLVDGDIFHGQLGLGQLFSARPVLGHANYRMPLQGLYLCASGAHPGGGVTGVPGFNAAREIIKDFQTKRIRA